MAYKISDECIACGTCIDECPVEAISEGDIYKIDATHMASERNEPRIFNMIVLGAFLKAKPIVKLENVRKGLEKSLPERHHKLIPMNLEAIELGSEKLEKVR